jgi:hypothetical protein
MNLVWKQKTHHFVKDGFLVGPARYEHLHDIPMLIQSIDCEDIAYVTNSTISEIISTKIVARSLSCEVQSVGD